MVDIGPTLQAIGDIIDIISQLFKKRETLLNEIAALSEDEYSELAPAKIDELNALSNEFNTSSEIESLINSPYATEQQKEELESLELSQYYADTDIDVPKEIENQKNIEKRVKEIVEEIDKEEEVFRVELLTAYEKELGQYLKDQQLNDSCGERAKNEGLRLIEKGVEEKSLNYILLSINRALIEYLLCKTEEDKCDGKEYEFTYGFANALLQEFDIASIYELIDNLQKEAVRIRLECFNKTIHSKLSIIGEVDTDSQENFLNELFECTYGMEISSNDVSEAKKAIVEYVQQVATDPYEQGQLTEMALSLFVPVSKLNLAKKATLLKKAKNISKFSKQISTLEEIAKSTKGKVDELKKVLQKGLAKAGDDLVDASGNVIGKFTRGSNLEIIDDVVLHGGNNIALSSSKTTTVTGVLDDVNTVAKRGVNPDGTFNGITTANGVVNNGGINILRDPRWGQIKAKHKAILDVGDELGYWQAVTDEFWNVANKPWLDGAISRGDNIRFVSDPFLDEAIYVTKNNSFVSDANGNKIKSIFGREVHYLQANGYNILPNGTAVKP